MRGAVPGGDPGNNKLNALGELLEKLTPLERQKYPVSPEFRWLAIVTIILAALTTPVFPFLPQTVEVGGWMLWWLGGSISWIMEFVARYWLVEVALGGVAFLLTLYLVVASHWLRDAPKKMQWFMVGSSALIVPNVLALLSILVLWVAVIIVWAFLLFLVIAIIGLFVQLFSSGR
jgi:hypothetical protein